MEDKENSVNNTPIRLTRHSKKFTDISDQFASLNVKLEGHKEEFDILAKFNSLTLTDKKALKRTPARKNEPKTLTKTGKKGKKLLKTPSPAVSNKGPLALNSDTSIKTPTMNKSLSISNTLLKSLSKPSTKKETPSLTRVKNSHESLNSSPLASQSPSSISASGKKKTPSGKNSSATKWRHSSSKKISPVFSRSKKYKTKSYTDRFIPAGNNLLNCQFQLSRSESNSAFNSDPKADSTHLSTSALEYQYQIATAVGLNLDRRILAFHHDPPKPSNTLFNTAAFNPHFKKKKVPAAGKRFISNVPERVLDAPGLVDDYYLNLLDWSSSNILGVGLGSDVFLWNATSGEVNELCSLDDQEIAGLSWHHDGAHIALGTNEGNSLLFDHGTSSLLRTLQNDHPTRVNTLDWSPEGLLATGSRSGSIHVHDVRVRNSAVMRWVDGHTGDVAGIKWNGSGTDLASGGNDNLVNLWDVRMSDVKYTRRDHCAAVKALAWCPWQSTLLATGGGSNDHKINFYNTGTGNLTSSITTNSQVTGLIWSKSYKEIFSSHGFENNEICVWKYPTMTRSWIREQAHDSRVLYIAASPDGQTICSGAGDENLKFWKVFSVDEKFSKNRSADGTASSGSGDGLTGTKKFKSPDFGNSLKIR